MMIDVKELRGGFLKLEQNYRAHPKNFRAVVLGNAGEASAEVAADRWTAYVLSLITMGFFE